MPYQLLVLGVELQAAPSATHPILPSLTHTYRVSGWQPSSVAVWFAVPLRGYGSS